MDAQPVYNQLLAFARITGATGAFVANRNLIGQGVGGVARTAAGTYSVAADDVVPFNINEIEVTVTILSPAAGPIISVTVDPVLGAGGQITYRTFNAAGAATDADHTVSFRRIVI
jgi:hypothetical protein